MPPLRVETYDEGGFSLLRENWNRLLAQSGKNTVFLTWEWQATWWEVFGSDKRLRLLTASEGDTLLGIAPLCLVESAQGLKTIHLAGGREVSDYLDIIAISDREKEVWKALWDHLLLDAAWGAAKFYNVPGKSPTLKLLPTLAKEQGFAVETQLEDVCPVLDLPLSWEKYLDRLERKDRHELRRKLRRAQRESRGDIDWYVVSDPEALDHEISDFLELHRKSQLEKRAFMDEDMETFFRILARSTLQAGWLQLSFLRVHGAKVASILSFDYGDEILIYNSGYDPDRFAWVSPGIVALTYNIQEAIARGKKRIDFLQGAEDYKYRFGARDTQVYNLSVARRSRI